MREKRNVQRKTGNRYKQGRQKAKDESAKNSCGGWPSNQLQQHLKRKISWLTFSFFETKEFLEELY
jgi:hypothetical protein